jgi:hypothetical protein
MRNMGIAVIVLGVIITLYTGFDLVTKKTVLEVGTVDITRDVNHWVTWSPILGIVTIVIGAGILFFGIKKSGAN